MKFERNAKKIPNFILIEYKKAEIPQLLRSAGLCCLFGISVFFFVLTLGLTVGNNGNDALVALALVEVDRSVNQSIQRVVLTDSHVVTRIVLRTALANDDVTSYALLTAEDLNAESLSS